MLKFLPSPVIGVVAALLIGLNTILMCSILFIFVFLKLIIPFAWIRHQLSRLLIVIATSWVDNNSLIYLITDKIKFDVQGIEQLSPKSSYLVISNHRSTVDIFVLQHVFRHRIPFLKFFIKKELIWVPFLGLAWWGLDFPILKRYSKQFLEKHPELRGKDIETTRKQCEKFKKIPVSVMNFVEGTRFDIRKHEKQHPPYRHLLLPKAGGIALVLSTMGDYLSGILDVTIAYPGNERPVGLWDLLTENIPRITVRVNTLNVPDNLLGRDYEEDLAFRDEIKIWVNKLWQEKDHRIDAVMKEYAASPAKHDTATRR